MNRLLVHAGLLAVFLAPGPAAVLCAQDTAPAEPGSALTPAIKDEVKYAEWLLNRMQLPDYAKIVIDRVRDKAPGVEAMVKVIELQSLLSINKFKEAEAIIAKEKNQDSQETWAMKLALADAHYAWGRYLDAKTIYDAFFAKFPKGPPDAISEFYISSAYRYAQMLIMMNNDAAAVLAYRNLLKAKLEKGVRRQASTELAELLVKQAETATGDNRKKIFAELKQLTTEILWVPDLWFGKAIVILAHMRMMDGDIAGAQKLIDDFGKQLRDIDENLKKQEQETKEPLSRLSPMAECRYLMGVMMQQEAEKLLASGGETNKVIVLLAGKALADGKRTSGALQHFVNVFSGYPETSWAPDAGIRADKVESILTTRFGAQIKRHVTPELMARVEHSQFQEARGLFNQQQYKEAAENYLKVLNLFPENEAAVPAIGELNRCYVELNEDDMAEMVLRYLCERFSKKMPGVMEKAGDQVLRTAEAYGERNMADRRDAVYKRFFEYFPAHPLAAGSLFRFGEQKFKDGDFAGALEYYLRIEAGHTNSPLYKEALNKITYCYAKTENAEEEIKALGRYIKCLENESKPGSLIISAKFRQAVAYRRLGPKFMANALNRFNDIVAMLGSTNNTYNSTPEDTKRNEETLEGAMFFGAACYAQLMEPADKVTSYRNAAIKSLEQLLVKYPKTKFAPDALSQIATLWTLLEKPEEAGKTLKLLQKDYPESPQARNSRYMLGKNLLDMGMRQQAIKVFKEMFVGEGNYRPAEMLTVAKLMHDAREYDIALEAYDRVLAGSKERPVRETAYLGKGKLLIDQRKFEEGAKALQALLTEYSNTGYLPDICASLSRAYGELGSSEPDAVKRLAHFNEAVKVLNRALNFDTSPGRQAALNVSVARVQMLKAAAETQFGSKEKAKSYRGEAMFTLENQIFTAETGNPEVRPHLEESYHLVIPLLVEAERWQDALEDCDGYMDLFPTGKHVSEISSQRSRIKMRLAASGGAQPPTGAGKEETRENGEPGAAKTAAPAAVKTDK